MKSLVPFLLVAGLPCGCNARKPTVASFLLDRTHEAAFFAAAGSGQKSKVPGQQCEAWYFAAFKRELSGDRNGYGILPRCLATGKKAYYEYSMAIDQLRRLKETEAIGNR
jgi:hypothetical protein